MTEPSEFGSDGDFSGLAASGWFPAARFGVLIHWGLSSLFGKQAWVASHQRLTAAELDELALHFEPDCLSARDWVELVSQSGAGYVIITAKHHDGFCLWNTAYSEFSLVNTPAKKDFLREFLDEARAAGLRVGVFYSLVDWHHSEFPIDQYHPLRDLPDAVDMNRVRDLGRYRLYLHDQIEELLTNYGPLDYLFFDFSYPGESSDRRWQGKGRDEWGSEELLARIREISPATLVNNHLDIPGDIDNPEEHIPQTQRADAPFQWEVCQNVGGTWGYESTTTAAKSTLQLVTFLIDCVAAGGNLQLHVAADGRGALSEIDAIALRHIGEWMRDNRRAIVDCSPSEFAPPSDVRYTQNGQRLFVHLFSWPARFLHLPGLASRVTSARFLHNNTSVETRSLYGKEHSNAYPHISDPTVLTLVLPDLAPRPVVPVIELILRK